MRIRIQSVKNKRYPTTMEFMAEISTAPAATSLAILASQLYSFVIKSTVASTAVFISSHIITNAMVKTAESFPFCLYLKINL